MLAALVVVARVHLQGLESGAMVFVWVPWPLVIQTENWSEISRPVADAICHTLLKLSSLGHWRKV